MFGGKMNLMVQMNNELRKKLEVIGETAYAEGRNVNEVLLENLK